jgi:hypothetical protein
VNGALSEAVEALMAGERPQLMREPRQLPPRLLLIPRPKLLPAAIGERNCVRYLPSGLALIVPLPFLRRFPAIASPLAVFHEFNHGLHTALVRGKLYAPAATITAGRAVRRGVFFELAQHAVDDVAVIVCHRRLLPFHDGADAKPAKRNPNKKEQ